MILLIEAIWVYDETHPSLDKCIVGVDRITTEHKNEDVWAWIDKHILDRLDKK